jgi:hypothetical protein
MASDYLVLRLRNESLRGNYARVPPDVTQVWSYINSEEDGLGIERKPSQFRSAQPHRPPPQVGADGIAHDSLRLDATPTIPGLDSRFARF